MVVFAMPERAATDSTVTDRGPLVRSSSRVASAILSSTSCRGAIRPPRSSAEYPRQPKRYANRSATLHVAFREFIGEFREVMDMLRKSASMTYAAYVLLLLAFVALGIFVYALATGSASAGIAGGGLFVLMVASVAGFRVGARNRANANDSGIEIEGANIWEQ